MAVPETLPARRSGCQCFPPGIVPQLVVRASRLHQAGGTPAPQHFANGAPTHPGTRIAISDSEEGSMTSAFKFPRSVRPSCDGDAGIARKTRGGFRYRDNKGRIIRDQKVLARIRALAIPPAWTQVWICPSPNGHLQAVGRDARGRKQYRYHPAFRAGRTARSSIVWLPLDERYPNCAGASLAIFVGPVCPREGPGGGRAVARSHPPTHWQCRISSDEPVVWPFDAPRPPRLLFEPRRASEVQR